MKCFNAMLCSILLLTCVNLNVQGQDQFYAYHTKVVHTSTDYFGKYADLIVVLGEGKQLEFTRRTQYRPLWVTPGGAYMVDDFFPGRDLDANFDYNYVRLMEETPEKIVVHWRYFPDIQTIDKANEALDPTIIDGFTAAVHEFFTIYPDGKVERVVKDARGSDYYSWQSPDYGNRQTLMLTDDAVQHGSVSWGNTSLTTLPAYEKNPVIEPKGMEEPVLAWSFDEGGGDFPEELAEDIEEMMEEEPGEIIGMTIESVNSEFNEIVGHGPVYKPGVSGTALGFDGYYTGVMVPEFANQPGTSYYREDGVPEFGESLSLEAWLALDAYPYNNAPIIHHSKNFGEEGFYFGVDPYGHLVFTANGNTVKSTEVLELYRWTHVVGAIGNGEMKIYLDGEEVASGSFEGSIGRPDSEFMIGLNTDKERCSDYVRTPQQNIDFIYGLQALLDEVKVYDKALTSRQVKNHYDACLPQDRTSSLEKAVLPGEVGVAEEFGAYYKNLEHHELWDKMWRLAPNTNIVVKFDNSPASVVYWHGTNFAANWVVDNNRWMADQSSEIFTDYGCSEHMADKQTRHSYARIIENNPARVVIHWRYPCVDVGYVCTNRRNWSDEYHTIYPDGTAIRKVVFNNTNPPGFQDIQLFTNPGEAALDVVDINAMTIANTKGDTYELVWKKPNKNPAIGLEDATIQLVNTKSEWKVFAMYPGPGIGTWGEFEQSQYTDDPFAGPWNHWPISMVPSDGRYAVAQDRVTHFALGAADSAPEMGSMVHYGFTDQAIETLMPKARYWQSAPAISNVKGGTSAGFEKQEKAYLITTDGAGKMSFTIDASAESPVINPAFVIYGAGNEDIKLKVDGKNLKNGDNLRIGKEYDVNGEPMLIVWLAHSSEKPVSVDVTL